MLPPIKGKLRIKYPCTWSYKIFGTDQTQMQEAAGEILSGHDYTITPSNSSRTGKYHCMNLEITVVSEEERTRIYEALRGHHSIVLVL